MTTARRRTSSRRRTRGSSTPTMWWNEQSANNLLAVGASSRFSLANPNNVNLPGTFQAGFTAVRMILNVIIRSEVLNQANFGAYGVLVNTALSTIDAILDLYDYYVHRNWHVLQVAPTDLAQAEREDYDIRTARRVRGEQRSLDFVITNNAASGGAIRWTVGARLLLKGS